MGSAAGSAGTAASTGLFTNSIIAIELVTADGALRRVDADNEPELFWALRGGGGNFGVVTALEFRLYPISEVYAGALFFPWERSAEALHAWRNWIRTVPDEVTSVGRILQFPPIDEVPEPMRGRSFAIVHAYSLGTEAEGIERLAAAPGARPRSTPCGWCRRSSSSEMHMDPPDPLPYFGEHLVLRDVPAAAIDDFVAAAGPGSGSTLASVEIRHAGGALGRGGEGHGALDKLPGEFVYFGIGMASDELEDSATRRDLHRVTGALRPYRSGSYLNFEEEAADPASFYGEETYRRLRAGEGRRRPGRAVPREPPDPARGSVVTRALALLSHGRASRPAVRGGLRATNVRHRRRGRNDHRCPRDRRHAPPAADWSGLLAPLGGLGLVAGLITIFLSPAGDETGDTPAEVVAWATTHRTWNVALLLFAVASIGLGGMFVAGLHARLRAVATDTESALILIGGAAFTLCFAFCWISWLGPLDGIAADEQLALAQAVRLPRLRRRRLVLPRLRRSGRGADGRPGVACGNAGRAAVLARVARRRCGAPSAATIVFFGIFGWMAWIAVASILLLVARRGSSEARRKRRRLPPVTAATSSSPQPRAASRSTSAG